jgi:hypothetical protein
MTVTTKQDDGVMFDPLLQNVTIIEHTDDQLADVARCADATPSFRNLRERIRRGDKPVGEEGRALGLRGECKRDETLDIGDCRTKPANVHRRCRAARNSSNER